LSVEAKSGSCVDIAHIVGDLVIALICTFLLYRLRAGNKVSDSALLVGWFFQGVRLMPLLSLLLWRAFERQLLAGHHTLGRKRDGAA
jgi:hypothetical protein